MRKSEESRTIAALSASRERVVVVGAGLAGLAVAARLRAAGREVLVLEASARAGGQVHTWREGALTVELGAEGFVARSRAVPALCARLGLEGELVDQLTTDTYAVEPSGLVLLPPGEAARRLGFQVPAEELGRGIRSLRLGMGQLTDALTASLEPGQLRLQSSVVGLSGGPGQLLLELEGGTTESATHVVVASPARRAAALLGPQEGAALADAPLMSNVSVNLLYQRDQLRLYPAGSGLVFPERFGSVGLRALSLVEHKFSGRVAPGQSLIRVFFRPVADALSVWEDHRFASEATLAIAQVLGAEGAPARTWVSRWADALPVFSPAYREQAAAADRALQARGVHVTGSAFHGAGLDAAVRSAEVVAARLGAAH
ncbi:MAG: FAD-binding protein [Myxococcales bacterium]|nr:MAG: FAD-binding protein [Myxococcales bacterium]